MAERRTRLLRVRVQADFAIDDGECLTPWAGPVVEILAPGWKEFADKAFTPDDLAAVLAQYELARPEQA